MTGTRTNVRIPARCAAEGSVLGTGFAEAQPMRSAFARLACGAPKAIAAVGGEPIPFALPQHKITQFLKDNGWIATDIVTLSELYDRYVTQTKLPPPPDVPGATNLSAILAPR